MPAAVGGWYLLNRWNGVLAEWFLIAMGLWFYGSFGLWYLVVLASSVAVNYGIGSILRQSGARSRGRGAESAGTESAVGRPAAGGALQAAKRHSETKGSKALLAVGIAVNLGFLCWFKYITPSLTTLLEEGQITTAPAFAGFLSIGLPIGFSFYTFSQISYLIDSSRGELQNDGFRRYVLYLTYFPKIIEGPITCYEEIAEQFRDPARRSFDGETFIRGFCLFVFGLAKKLLIADVLSAPATFGIQSAYYLDTVSVLVTMSCYALQLYMDFSGYCDMAMGVSQMLNIRLPLNFDAPFQAESFPEFWKRWHMTLTRFFTRYVYIPLGGSRKGQVRTCVNVMIIFVLSAFWHGLGTTYLIWGLLSGAFVVAGNLVRKYYKNRQHVSQSESGTATMAQGRKAPSQGGMALSQGKMALSQDRKEQAQGRKALSESQEEAAGSGRKIAQMGKRAGVYLLFLFTLIFFGAPSLEYSGAILRRFFVPLYPGWLYRLAARLDLPEFWLFNKAVAAAAPGLSNPVLLAELLIVLLIALILVNSKRTAVKLAETMELNTKNAILVGALLVICLCSVSGVSTYLYFQF